VADLDALADALLEAERDAVAVPPVTEQVPGLTIDDAYAVQSAIVDRRVRAGEQVVGLTVVVPPDGGRGDDDVVTGTLLSGAVVGPEESVPVGGLLAPAVSAGIVLKLARALPPSGVTSATVLDAVAGVCAALEIADSRYGRTPPGTADLVADNASTSRLVLGPMLSGPGHLNLALVGMLLEVDGVQVATAAGAAALGHPAAAVAAAAESLGRRGHALEAGWLVYSGRLTPLVPVTAGSHVRATFGHLGSVGTRIM